MTTAYTGPGERASGLSRAAPSAYSVTVECRPGCAACCIVISISSPLPGYPEGKPAGIPCPGLTSDNLCRLWGTDDYPGVCREFRAGPEYCGADNADARRLLAALERATTG